MTDYSKKYIDIVKCYHQLHAEIVHYQAWICLMDEEFEPFTNESQDKINKIDEEFKKIIKGKE